MFHVCIFTDAAQDKFIVTGGESEDEVLKRLAKIVNLKYKNRKFDKLVVFKSFLMVSEGETHLAAISKMENKDLSRLILSENPTMADLSKHLVNQ